MATPSQTRVVLVGQQELHNADCIEWLAQAPPNSVHAVITDPPYGLLEFAPEQQEKLRGGKGGVWRIPPSFDGARRRALPRFTVLDVSDRKRIFEFFFEWARALLPVLAPGAHVFVASNPLVSPMMAYALEQAGLERRGEIARVVRTFRGGDKPKGAEDEFKGLSTMPRSCWEPWGLFRKPISERTVAKNLRLWGTGALKRLSAQTPFLDLIQSETTPDNEREIAPHPSVKPQRFLRHLVKAALPLGHGTILDPFSGSGTTLAACEHLNVPGVGIERDPVYFDMAVEAIPLLSRILPTASKQNPLPGL